MKKIIAINLLLLMLVSVTFAGTSPATEKNVTFDRIESNLLAGIDTENTGLFVSSLQRLGDIKSDRAVIPLMRVLKNNESESARIAAALSLYKIGDSRGIFAVKQAAKFDNSERVRQICSRIYTGYKLNG